MSLTPKMERFVLARVEGLDASAAYRLAYNTANMKPATINRKAHELTQHGKITARLAELQAELVERSQVTAEWIIERLRENVERAMQRVEVRGHEGNALGEWQYQGAVANKSLELLMRYYGMLQPGASDEPPEDQPIYWRQRDPRSDLRVIDQPPARSNGAT